MHDVDSPFEPNSDGLSFPADHLLLAQPDLSGQFRSSTVRTMAAAYARKLTIFHTQTQATANPQQNTGFEVYVALPPYKRHERSPHLLHGRCRAPLRALASIALPWKAARLSSCNRETATASSVSIRLSGEFPVRFQSFSLLDPLEETRQRLVG